MNLTKSKQRVADHGEVFTPPWMVEAMLDLVKGESERIDSRFLEPACGDGNFLIEVLRRKLAAVELKYGRSHFQRRQFALLAVMCVYGVEILADNVAECRRNVLAVLLDAHDLAETDDLALAAAYVLSQNVVHGDALTMRLANGDPILFAEWGYLGRGKFQRRDFRLDVLTKRASFDPTTPDGALFAPSGHEVFTPVDPSYPPVKLKDLARAARPHPTELPA